MYRKILPISFGIILLLAFAGSAFALRTPGVYPGDWAVYTVLAYWDSEPPQPPSSYLLELNETLWLRFDVQSVIGTNVTGQTTWHFKNGSETVSNDWVDIDTGDGGNLTTAIVAANLNAGNTLYTSGSYSTWIINETIVKMYPSGVARDTNHINITMEETIPGYYSSQNYYWDRQTGVVVEMNTTYYYEDTMGNYMRQAILFQIVGSNMWIVPEFPTLPLILTAFIATSSFAILLKRRKLQTKTR